MFQRLFFSLLFFCVPLSYAHEDPLSAYFVDLWTSHDGLPHNSISAIAQTEDGYLWFATWEGVARYNGRSFTLFDRNEQTHMQDSGSKTLVADENNQLWVGGARGSLVTRQGKTWRPNTSVSGLINHVLVDQNKNLWIAIESLGVIFRPFIKEGQYGKDKWLIKDSSAYRLTKNNDGIYAGTADGLYKLTPTSADQISTNHFKHATYISTGNNGDILIGAENGAWRWDGESFHSFSSELSNQKITVVEQDHNGSYWFGTINKGVARLNNGE